MCIRDSSGEALYNILGRDIGTHGIEAGAYDQQKYAVAENVGVEDRLILCQELDVYKRHQENRAPLVLLVQQERRVQQVLPGGQERVPPVLPVQQGPLDRQESKAPPVPPDLREQQAPRDRLEQLGKPARQGQRGKQGPPVQLVRQGRQRISLTIRLPLLLIPNIRWYPGRRSPYFRT